MSTDIAGGIGHNLLQEGPRAFAQAVIDVDRGRSSAQLQAARTMFGAPLA